MVVVSLDEASHFPETRTNKMVVGNPVVHFDMIGTTRGGEADYIRCSAGSSTSATPVLDAVSEPEYGFVGEDCLTRWLGHPRWGRWR